MAKQTDDPGPLESGFSWYPESNETSFGATALDYFAAHAPASLIREFMERNTEEAPTYRPPLVPTWLESTWRLYCSTAPHVNHGTDESFAAMVARQFPDTPHLVEEAKTFEAAQQAYRQKYTREKRAWELDCIARARWEFAAAMVRTRPK